MYSFYKQTFSDSIKTHKQQRPVLFWLIVVNVVVWFLLSLFQLGNFLKGTNDTALSYLALPASIELLKANPWTLLTYMFTHLSFWHLFFNMIWLYWFGKIFLQYRNENQLFIIYLLGGIIGGLTFVSAYNIFPVFAKILPVSTAIGASASAMAIMLATAVLSPNYNISLLFLGNIKIKHIALIILIIDILSIRYDNPGGHFSHLGGALTGFVVIGLQNLYAHSKKNIKNRKEKSYVLRGKRKMQVTDVDFTEIIEKQKTKNKKTIDNQTEIDIILDKISKSGYTSLSKEEKDLLFNSSKK